MFSYSTQNIKNSSSSETIKYFSFENNQNLNFGFNLNWKQYQNSDPGSLFWGTSPNINLSFDQQKTSGKQNQVTTIDRFGMTNNHSATMTLFIGFGRLRIVTPLVQAIRMSERLNLISNAASGLNENQILSLAEKIQQESVYTSVFNRSEKYFRTSLFDGLVSNGGQDLSVFQKEYLMDVFYETRVARYEGYEILFGIHSDYNNQFSKYYNRSYQTSSTIESHLIGPFIQSQAAGSFSLNIGWRLYGEFSNGFSLSNLGSANQKYQTKAGGEIFYELSDEWVLSLSESYSYTHINFKPGYEVHKEYYGQNQVSGLIKYYLEDKLFISAQIDYTTLNQTRGNRLLYSNENFYDMMSFRTGITYYIFRDGLLPFLPESAKLSR